MSTSGINTSELFLIQITLFVFIERFVLDLCVIDNILHCLYDIYVSFHCIFELDNVIINGMLLSWHVKGIDWGGQHTGQCCHCVGEAAVTQC